MTREEYYPKIGEEVFIKKIPKNLQPIKEEISKEKWIVKDINEEGDVYLVSKDGKRDIGWMRSEIIGKPYHKDIVEQALKQGKPVPEEVLKDYPDLAEKYLKLKKAKDIQLLLEEARKHKNIKEFAKAFGFENYPEIKLGDLRDRLRAKKKELSDLLEGNIKPEYRKSTEKEIKEINRLLDIIPERYDISLKDVYKMAQKPKKVSEKPPSETKLKYLSGYPKVGDWVEFSHKGKKGIGRVVKIWRRRKYVGWDVETPEGKVIKGLPSYGVKRIEKPEKKIEFLRETPPIGLSIKEVIPHEMRIEKKYETIPIEIEKEPPDLVGLKGWLKSWLSPVRHIAEMNPYAEAIARMGRDTLTGLANEQRLYSERIDRALKGLSLKERKKVGELLDKELTEKEYKNLPEKIKRAYDELRAITKEMKKIAKEEIGIDVSKWGISEDAYFPHIFVGSYQILDGNRTIEGGFARSLEEALEKARAYLEKNPKANIKIKPRQFSDEYTATLLSRKGFWRFINEVRKATELDRDEILSMLKGVAAIKPRGKFVGNFERRVANLGGFIEDPKIAMKIYVNRILRKKYLDPFRKQATELATKLPPALRDYFLEYIDDVSGKYDPINKNFKISRAVSRITSLQSKLKLGFRPITAFVNRLQPLQLAYAEIGNYLFKGYLFKKTSEGKKIIEEAGIKGQKPKYFSGEFLAKSEVPLWHPLGAFSRAEMANREDVVAGGYLFAREVFKMSREKAEKMGYGYILDYLDKFKDPHKAALEYAKDLNADVNFIYDNSDIPKLFRIRAGRAIFQFKTFPINFTAQTIKWLSEFFKNPTPHNTARAIRFLYMNLLLGGVRTIPYLGRLLFKLLLILPVFATLHPKVRDVLARGIFALLGVDLSQRLGPNEFLPRNLRDLLGPSGNDLYLVYRYLRKEITLPELLTGLGGATRDLYRAFRMTENILDPNRRWRTIAKMTGWDKFLQAIGAPSLKVTVNRDLQAILSEIEKDYKKKRAFYIDRIIELREKGKKKEAEELKKKVNKEFNLGISLMDILKEERRKKIPAISRRLKRYPKRLRKEAKEIIKKALEGVR